MYGERIPDWSLAAHPIIFLSVSRVPMILRGKNQKRQGKGRKKKGENIEIGEWG